MPDFDPDKYLSSPDFDPEEYLKQRPQPEMSPGEAAVFRFGQGITGNSMDEIAGGIEAGIGKAGELSQKGLSKLGLSEKPEEKDLLDRYYERRNIHRAKAAQASKEHPYVGFGADLAGGAALAASPLGRALGPSKGAGLATNVAKSAGTGAAMGFAGSNSSVFDSPDQLKDALSDAGTGAMLGGSFTAAGYPVASIAKKMSPQALEKLASERAVKAAIGQNKKAIKDLAKTGQLEKTGRDLLDEGAIGWFSKAEDILPETKAAKAAIGIKIGEIGKEVDAMVPNAIDGHAIAEKLEKELSKIPATPKNDGVRNALSKEIDFYRATGPMSFSEAQELKGSYVFKPTDSTTQVLGQDVTNKARRAVSDVMKDSVKNIEKDAPPELADRLKLYQKLMSKYGSMSSAVKAGKDREASNLSNRFMSPSDYATGAAATLGSIIHGGLSPATALVGAGASLGNKFIRERGSAFAARTSDKLARIMAADPAGLNRFRGVLEDAAGRGPQALMLTHALLSEDPEYQQLIESQP